ncbi:MAG: c-type cytochrome [Cocleimonas sp.]|nr:c-type cytochrome [Cocleimonas sp.]
MKHINYLALIFSALTFISSPLLADTPLSEELKKAVTLEPNLEAGKEKFKLCITCHQGNGWGMSDGTFPQIAGQHSSVIMKQLIDIRIGYRNNPMMLAIVKEPVFSQPQAIADIAAYIETLPMTPKPGLGTDEDNARAEKLFYRKCAECHGADGGGDKKRFYPRIQGQHYEYLLRQIKMIRDGKRKNANSVMAKRVKKLKDKDLELLANYIARMKPPKDKLAKEGWKNPDFK